MEIIEFVDLPIERKEADLNFPLLHLRRLCLRLPRTLITAVEEALWRKGRQHQEEMVLLAGVILKRSQKKEAIVTSVIVPDSISTFAEVRLSQDEILRVSEAVAQRGLRVFAQVHTHPGDWVGLSSTDLRFPFSFTPGFLQVVVPRYCKHGLLTNGTAIYETLGIDHRGLLKVRRLSTEEIQERFRVFDPPESSRR